ncbi:Oidioi.mRNA.OKI2018_I69.chr2.g5278.t1.cds [Oikopleura dioica]|uniref:Oidioi.mRNA.OKI2018_I69.chr2.g5278.t1.cds n=1 Tax=Oikopleura dioica TaxID=34765 RepID=A0ABN7T5I0_OIKDI|nr:Oidioi.mRNA.OKI2018_I69.chr2.g5278.t1.cds [Oikopleura dioica]
MSEEQRASLFLGGRYYSSYFDLTCALSQFCCSTENQPVQLLEPWEIIGGAVPNRYEYCWVTSADTTFWKEKPLTVALTPLLVEYNCAKSQFCIPGEIPKHVLPVDEFNTTTLTNNCQADVPISGSTTSQLTKKEQTIIFSILGALFFLILLFVLRKSIRSCCCNRSCNPVVERVKSASTTASQQSVKTLDPESF